MLLHELRHDYGKLSLDEASLDANPARQFELWLHAAIEASLPEPNAMVLATADSAGIVSTRTVLLKAVTDGGLGFFSNYQSRKGIALLQNPHASATFVWLALERQVHVEGVVLRAPPEVSDDYFQSRPRDAQVGAWASRQSAVVRSRAELDDNFARAESEFAEKSIARPPHWGGYVLHPARWEFWQGRPGRMHDRIVYERQGVEFRRMRLAP
jgi:pyridoxamine 5'-phosphate oxidase